MQRRRLRAAALGVAAAALLGLGYQVVRRVAASRARSLETLGVALLPRVAQRIQNFRRVKVENGRTVWEIAAREARYLADHDEVIVSAPEVKFFTKRGRTVELRSDQGRLHLRGRDLERIELSGNIVLAMDDMRLETAEAFYDRDQHTITSPGRVAITSATVKAFGRSMEVDVTTRRVRLLGGVRVELQPSDGQEQ